ncbi:MAG TPA: energy transducer TonB [Candidatus Polarisedimenticolia bacterium]|nr:energy transducer TonB [Candidatus Polarisedimenticolia bacterium]
MNTLFGKKRLVLLACLLGMLFIGSPSALAQSAPRKVLKKVDPVYPTVLRERRIGGTVRLKATVRADGTVREVHVVGGNPILVESAISAVKLWRYSPGDGETTAEVVIHFHPYD